MMSVATAGLAALGILFDRGEVQQASWPPEHPVVENQLIRYRFSPPRQRMRLVGGQWLGWDTHAPASVTIRIDEHGASVFGVRCRLSAP